ncbi:hypothetical protein D3C76_1625820 [compost metagenome]
MVGHFGQAFTFGHQAPQTTELSDANQPWRCFQFTRVSAEVTDQGTLVGAFGFHPDDHVARAGGPGQVGGEVDPGAVALDTYQAH